MHILKRCIISLDQAIPYWAINILFGVATIAYAFGLNALMFTFSFGVMLVCIPKMLRWLIKD